jgi:hypothetical protein
MPTADVVALASALSLEWKNFHKRKARPVGQETSYKIIETTSQVSLFLVFFSKIFSHLEAVPPTYRFPSASISLVCVSPIVSESDYFLQEFNPHRFLNKYLADSLHFHRISNYSAGRD